MSGDAKKTVTAPVVRVKPTAVRIIGSTGTFLPQQSNVNAVASTSNANVFSPSRVTVCGGGSPVVRGVTVKRPLEYDFSSNSGSHRKTQRSTDKSKGLRHFSTKVCEKVKEKGTTNYNEVADELVQEYFESLNPSSDDLFLANDSAEAQQQLQYDMKNIRRRVYDALNVLMAMNIIEKQKKEIRWVGLPSSPMQECKRLQEEKSRRHQRIKQKAEQLQELIVQLVSYKNLVSRNREKERRDGRPPADSLLYLPYIIVTTDRKTIVDCSISLDKTEYLLNFDQPFEIHDDTEVLKRLGLSLGLENGRVSNPEHVQSLKALLPPALRDYVDEIAQGRLGTNTNARQPLTAVGGGQETSSTSQVRSADVTNTPQLESNPCRANTPSSVVVSGVAPPLRYAVVPAQHKGAYVISKRQLSSSASAVVPQAPGPRVLIPQAAFETSRGFEKKKDERQQMFLAAALDNVQDDFSDIDSLGSNSNQGF